MRAEKTIEERYQELKQLVPAEIREKFEQMEAGLRLPDMTADLPFKRIYDAEVHPERISYLLQLIFGEEFTVSGSVREEMLGTSIYSKKSILDVLARLSNQGIADVEMQVVAQEFIVQRSELYAADMIVMQYSARKNQLKSEITYLDVPVSYIVILMKESPKIFANDIARNNSEYSVIQDELKNLIKSREELIVMLADKYEEIIRNSEIAQARREGEEFGEARGEAKGEARLAKLVNILLENEDFAQVSQVTTDKELREKLYIKYEIM
ncbi:MAG: PD-(D/E)XK nuclease family transposase [Lachnospiraceae bacterium]|nr:PD-(D/E)XK nuclease family transposase [Lachnospiraceae bacterium]MDD3615114.1 PD-(D/E)XK nuclease family transposase [Lachnospiraceae bacterium]